MASDGFNQLQTQITVILEKLKTAADYGERRELLTDLRRLIDQLEREVHGGRR
jgi:hypothetical protein